MIRETATEVQIDRRQWVQIGGNVVFISQSGQIINTKSATMTTTDATPLTTALVKVNTDSSQKVTGNMVARDTSTGASHEWEFSVLIKNVAGTTSIVGNPLVTDTYYDSATSTWTFDVSADDSSDSLDITMTGEAAKTIHWNVRSYFVEAK